MNINKLKQAETVFLTNYPDGFSHSEFLKIGKHVEKMNRRAHDLFSVDKFADVETINEQMIKLVSSSSLVSKFEKPKYRDYVRKLSSAEKERLSSSLYHFLHGNQQLGFDMMVDVLEKGRLAKWTLVTAIPYHFNPTVEVFIKPTTTKAVIKHFELANIVYHPQPTFEFYRTYRDLIQQMKTKTDVSLSSDSAAFTGFLMIAMQDDFIKKK